MRNIFSNDRVSSNDAIEGGQSLTIGTEYKITKNNLIKIAAKNENLSAIKNTKMIKNYRKKNDK